MDKFTNEEIHLLLSCVLAMVENPKVCQHCLPKLYSLAAKLVGERTHDDTSR
jgi:hypothetical protein